MASKKISETKQAIMDALKNGVKVGVNEPEGLKNSSEYQKVVEDIAKKTGKTERVIKALISKYIKRGEIELKNGTLRWVS